MLKSFIIAALGIIGMMMVWTLVQTLWRKTFTGSTVGEDVLVGRRSCSGCSCTTTCKKDKQ